MPRYSVGIYNAQVRAKLAEGERHRQLNDDWADIHYFDITADSPEQARLRIHQRYPMEQGYLIASIDLDD
jgi:hypothetical protein